MMIICPLSTSNKSFFDIFKVFNRYFYPIFKKAIHISVYSLIYLFFSCHT